MPMSLACATLALLFIPLTAALAQQPSPIDYDDVPDILNGQHSLLQIDDLLVLRQYGQNVAEYQYKTSNSSPLYPPANATTALPSPVISAPAIAKMFRTGGPVLVFAGGNSKLMPVLMLKDANPSKTKTVTTELPNGTILTSPPRLTVADFTGDGLDDIVVDTDKGVQACTARDPNVFDLQLRCGPLLHFSTRRRAATSGDFNGDGRQRLALVGQYIGGEHISLWVFNVDQKTLAMSTAGYNETKTAIGSMRTYAIASGKFTLTDKPQHDQLALAYQTDTGNTQIVTVDFPNSSFQPQFRRIWDSGYVSGAGVAGGVILKRAHLDWFSPYDQLAFLVSQFERQQTLAILAVTPDTLAIRKASSFSLPAVGLGYSVVTDVAIGNFDRNTRLPNGQTQHDPNLQLALSAVNLENSFRPQDFSLSIINVDPGSDFKLSVGPKLNVVLPPNQTVTGAVSVVAADLQNRSIELGPPTKIVINNQGGPSVVTAVPPMHVDYIAPFGSATPTLLNLSGSKNALSTSYETNSSARQQATTQNTTSYTFGLAESIGGKLTFGNPKKSHISVGLQFAADQTFEDGVEKNNSNTGLTQFSASVKTGEADQVWYDQSRLNIYSYPVIGKMVCPPQAPDNCPAADKVPLTVAFSAVDLVDSANAPGSQIEWYQPAWEVGNVLSYPASYSQLLLLYPDLEKLAAAGGFFTDDTTQTIKTNWSDGSSTGETVSSARRFGEEGGVSVAGAIGIAKIAGLEGAFDFNVSGSQAFENLNTTLTELEDSSGVTVEKARFSGSRRYAYGITPYIFGRTARPDAVDQANLDGSIKTAGPVQAAFVADPLRTNSGDWWKAAYSKAPDVALNHPARWDFEEDSKATSPNCVAGTCASLAPSRPNDPWKSDFHAMRGFFISDAVSPGEGPQLSTAIAGNKLQLETRVYNFSFVNMPAGSTVHVRFYVQPMDKEHALVGSSKLIGETVLPPIPPFNDNNGAPLNSVLARTTFDTTGYSNQYVTFWVVTWMQDAKGALVKEPEGHGLLGIPGTLNSLADVKSETYGNNVGFYKWLFYVMPRPGPKKVTKASLQSSRLAMASTADVTASSATPPAASSSILALQMMQLTNLEVSSGQTAALGEEVTVTTSLQAGSDPIPGAVVIFYDGDPKNGGQVFDMENIPYVRANDFLQVEVPFRAKTCGSNDLYAVTYQGTIYEKVSEPFVLQIDCPQ